MMNAGGDPEAQLWIANARVKVNEMKYLHYLQRVQLELAFETTPRDSRYSNGLLDLMKKEESMLKDSNMDSQSVACIVKKVDDLLRSETQAFFAKTSQQNIRRLQSLNEKQIKERNQMINYICIESRGALGAELLERESERLELDYHRNWFKYENYNLQQAFGSQSARVENDWKCHELSLMEEYKKRKERLLGSVIDISTCSAHEAQDLRWQHPEKQKTLIHTAPVLTPTRELNSIQLDSGKRSKGKKEAEVRNSIAEH